MPVPIREAVLAATAARIAAIITDVPLERARRAEVALAEMPRLILIGNEALADEGMAASECWWTIEMTVQGFAAAGSDAAAELALSTLHARLVATLQGWVPTDPLVQLTTLDAAFEMYDLGESAKAAGVFAARFRVQAVTPTGNPYAP